MTGAILTLGLGTFGGVHYLPTLGYLSGAPVPPAPDQSSSTPGFLRRPYILPIDSLPRKRPRIEEDEPEVVRPDPVPEYARQSAVLASEVARYRRQADNARARIAALERTQATEQARAALQSQRDDVARYEAAQARLLEELEIIDVAYVARAVIGMLH